MSTVKKEVWAPDVSSKGSIAFVPAGRCRWCWGVLESEQAFRLLDLIETLNDNAHGYLVRIEALKEELRDARAIISHDERAEAAE